MKFERIKEISKVVLFYLVIIILVILFIKLSIFYIPFLIGFVIAEFLEPAIKFLKNKSNLNRKTSSILVLMIFFAICIAISLVGIVFLVSETTEFLSGLNRLYRIDFAKSSRF